MSDQLVRVVKVGGSLFDLPDLGARLANWLESEPAATNVLLAGGGDRADAVRASQQRKGFDDVAAHWRCIEVLNETAEWLASLGPGWRLVSRLDDVLKGEGTFVFQPKHFLREFEPTLPGPTLPCNWDATSDSIAARLAVALAADELVLLKSCPPPKTDNLAALAEVGYVDRFFPNVGAHLKRIRFVDLRMKKAQPHSAAGP